MSETRLIHGFHAVTAKLRHAAEDIREITVAEGRQDGRMRELLKQAEQIRVIFNVVLGSIAAISFSAIARGFCRNAFASSIAAGVA